MELGMPGRGEHVEVMPFLETQVNHELSGNVIELCPVGALTSKPFRYKARSWELSRRKSVSPHDGLGANMQVHVKDNRVLRVVPLDNEAINECWIADRDRFSYDALNGDQRLTQPMLKRMASGKWRLAGCAGIHRRRLSDTRQQGRCRHRRARLAAPDRGRTVSVHQADARSRHAKTSITVWPRPMQRRRRRALAGHAGGRMTRWIVCC
jgi:hypothetical protein